MNATWNGFTSILANNIEQYLQYKRVVPATVRELNASQH